MNRLEWLSSLPRQDRNAAALILALTAVVTALVTLFFMQDGQREKRINEAVICATAKDSLRSYYEGRITKMRDSTESELRREKAANEAKNDARIKESEDRVEAALALTNRVLHTQNKIKRNLKLHQ